MSWSRWLRHLFRVLHAAFLFGRGGGRASVLVVVLLGVLALLLALSAKAAAPIAAYPFA